MNFSDEFLDLGLMNSSNRLEFSHSVLPYHNRFVLLMTIVIFAGNAISMILIMIVELHLY
jgi:hypothetical protein